MSTQPNPSPEDRVTVLEKKIGDLEQNWSRLKWAASLIGLAVLIVTGYGLVEIPRKAAQNVEQLAQEAAKQEVAVQIQEDTRQAIEQARVRATKAASTAEDALTQLNTMLKKLPAARYHCKEGYTQTITVDDETGAIINFSHVVYDTHNAVASTGDWKYEVKESGVYTVTAYAFCTQRGGSTSAGSTEVALYKNSQRVTRLATQSNASSIVNTMIGGTADIELQLGDLIDIRAFALGNVSEASIGGDDETWFSIHYVRPIIQP